MADLATLRDLRDRLANATGASDELDERIALAFYPDCFADAEKTPAGWRHARFGGIRIDPATASIDAAVALCARVLPGTSLIMRRGYLGDYAACNVGKEPGGFRARETWGNAERPDNELALAICRAIVEGLIAQEEANG